MTQNADFGRSWDYVARTVNGEELGRWTGSADDEALAYFAGEYITADVETVKTFRLTAQGGEEYVGTANRTRPAE